MSANKIRMCSKEESVLARSGVNHFIRLGNCVLLVAGAAIVEPYPDLVVAGLVTLLEVKDSGQPDTVPFACHKLMERLFSEPGAILPASITVETRAKTPPTAIKRSAFGPITAV